MLLGKFIFGAPMFTNHEFRVERDEIAQYSSAGRRNCNWIAKCSQWLRWQLQSQMESPKTIRSRHGWLRCQFGCRFEVTPIDFFRTKINDFSTTAVFGKTCPRGLGAPETCLLEDMGLRKKDIEPFGYDKPVSQNYLNFRVRSLKNNQPHNF